MSLEYWIVAHTHWDREWYLSFQDFRWKLVGTIDGIIDTLESDDRFAHFMLDGQTVALEDYLEFRGERRGELERLVAEGRLAVGPWYVQPDDLLPSGEALVRNLERGIALAKGWGAAMKVGYLPDSFGHSGSMPSIFRGFGIDSACLMRGPGRALDRCLFEWKAQDGSSVLVAYLIDGYNNGSELTMGSDGIAGTLARLRSQQESQGALVDGLPLLVMNGYDHRPIESGLPGELAEAGLGESARIGSLEGYLELARRAAVSVPPPRWSGELRSTYRCPITAGCTSTRHWIKQEDQEISALLERRAEPLAALAAMALPAAASEASRPAGALDAAWKLLLLNQAHDSICGCSIDRVHEDMKYRFAQARSIADNVAASAAAEIAGQIDTVSALRGAGEPPAGAMAVVVLNPGPRRGVRLVELEIPSPPSHPIMIGPGGEPHDVQTIIGEGGSTVFFDEHFKPGQIKLALGLVRGGELMNYRITGASLSRESTAVLRVDLELSDARQHTSFDWESWHKEARAELERPGLQSVHAVGRRAGPTTILFAADAPEFGAACHTLRRGADDQPAPTLALTAGKRSLENEFFRVRVVKDGCLEVLDKTGGTLYRGLNALVDGGDRGDEYNYDRPPLDLAVQRPSRGLPRSGASVRLVESGPLRATILVESQYRIPLSVDEDRRRRSKHRVALITKRRVSLSAGSRRIEFRTEIVNAASDHRLRVRFPLPGFCAEAEAGGNFEVYRCSCTPDLPKEGESLFGPSSDTRRELPPLTHPFAGFVGAAWSNRTTGSRGGVALLAKGLREYELIDHEARTERLSDLYLTLFRSVGRLSRGDLVSRSGHAGPDIPTPAAQELGTWTFEYALTAYEGDLTSSGVCEEWADYRSPLCAVVQAPHPGRLGPQASLLALDADGLVFSSLRRTGKGALSLRYYEVRGRAGKATIRMQTQVIGAKKTRLDGEAIEEIPVSDDRSSFTVDFSPHEIVTVELETGMQPQSGRSAPDPTMRR